MVQGVICIDAAQKQYVEISHCGAIWNKSNRYARGARSFYFGCRRNVVPPGLPNLPHNISECRFAIFVAVTENHDVTKVVKPPPNS